MSRPIRRLVVAVAVAAAAAIGPIAPAAHAKATKAQCAAVETLMSVNPDPAATGKKAKAELARLKAAESKVPAKIKADAKKVRVFWEAIVKWTAKYPDPNKAMLNPKGLVEYGKIMEKVGTDFTPAVQRIVGWSMMECSG